MSFIELYRIPFWARSPKSSWQVWRTECNLGSSRCNIFMQQQSARKYCTICWEVLHDLHGSIARYAGKYCTKCTEVLQQRSADLFHCDCEVEQHFCNSFFALFYLRPAVANRELSKAGSGVSAILWQRAFGERHEGEGLLQQLAKYAQRQVQAQRQAQCQVCTTTDNHASGLDQLRKEQMCSSADPVFMTDSKRTLDNGTKKLPVSMQCEYSMCHWHHSQ